ncbi:segregation protein B [Alteromonas australica]|jgi:cysteine desulfuration protein SufE|uniref:SufE family protein n=1 Tax=Alteromonas sp. B31-7 TaxID=2785913 RepID=UPI0005C428D8|nr:SufE family protein [Alteromonas sp. B31-7]AJP43690.1 segregation protein B [Alteromonas australica]QPL48502.1 SufE family protein [Alteromonas sp. B31-7]
MCSSQFPSDPLPIAQSVASAKGWDGATRAMMLAAKQLPILPEALRTAQHYVPGCDSDVWLGEVASDASASMQEETHTNIPTTLAAYSPSKIIRGVLAVLLEKANQLTAEQRRAFDFHQYLRENNLERHLSQSRANGINAVLARLSGL